MGLQLPGRLVRRQRFAAQLGVLAFAAAGLCMFAAPVSAATSCVNPGGTGGCRASINDAIQHAQSGDTIVIQAGTYQENVVVSKSVTLQGQSGGDEGGGPVIYPAHSDPNCGGAGGGTLCTPNNTVILVQADNVTISGLVVDGDNPHLHSGVSVGGADIDARNGIATDSNTIAMVLGLTIHHTTVRNVFRRGIQVTSNTGAGAFSFHDNVVRNVQGDPNTSVAMISNGNAGNSGVMANNVVSDSSDALNSNNSHGIQFINNRVVRSGSGVHTDNAGDGGGAADLIRGNDVRDCMPGGIGLFTFVSYLGPSVTNNSVSNCDIGLAAYGTKASATATFSDNTVEGSGAAGTIGALVTTDLSPLGPFGVFNVSASLVNNDIQRFATGIQVVQNGGMTATATVTRGNISHTGTGLEASAATVSIANACVSHNKTGILADGGASLSAHQNDIMHNSAFGADNMNGAAPIIDATNNWWGSASGPKPVGKGDLISAGVSANPFLHSPTAACSHAGEGDDQSDHPGDHSGGD